MILLLKAVGSGQRNEKVIKKAQDSHEVVARDQGSISGVRTNGFRKELAVPILPRSARTWQAEEVRMGAAVSRWACQTQTPPLAGMNYSGRGGLRWGYPAGQFKAHSTSKYPS